VDGGGWTETEKRRVVYHDSEPTSDRGSVHMRGTYDMQLRR